MAIYTEAFAGGAANLTTPWVQWRVGTGGVTAAMRRNGSGLATMTDTNTDSGAIYNNTVGNDQYTQIVPQFNGPADGSKYIYLFLRAPNTTDSYNSSTDADLYWFWSDGGSDTQIVYTTSSIAGVVNIKTDNSFTFSSGDTIKFEVIGTTLKVYKNGVVHSGLTVTDSHVTSGFPGFGGWGSGPPTYDNWEGGDAHNYTATLSSTLGSVTCTATADKRPIFRSSNFVAYGGGGTATNVTVTAPSGIQNGDLLLYCVWNAKDNGTGIAPTVTFPAGFTKLPSGSMALGTLGLQMSIGYKIAASEAGDYTATFTASYRGAAVLCYSGVDATHPITVTPTYNAGTDTSNGSGPVTRAVGLFTEFNNSMIVYFGFDNAVNANNLSPPGGSTPTFTERVESPLIYAADGILSTAGATGEKFQTNNNGSSDFNMAAMVALNPSGSTPGPTRINPRSASFFQYAGYTNPSLSRLPSVVDGDLLVMQIVVGKSGTPPTPTFPSGFTEITGSPVHVSLSGFEVNHHIAWKRASSEPSSYPITLASASAGARLVAYSGAGVSPITVTPTHNDGTNATTTATGLTTTMDGSMILIAGQDWGALSTSLTPPTGTTPTFKTDFDPTPPGSLVFSMMSGIMTTAGATGNKTFTNNNNSGNPWSAYMIAIDPMINGTVSSTLDSMTASGAGHVSTTTVSLTDNQMYAGGTGTTMGSLAIGAAAADRIVIIAVAGTNSGSALAPTTFTLNGTPMNVAKSQAQGDVGGNGEFTTIYWLPVSTGTTASLVFSWGGATVFDMQVSAYRTTGLNQSTPVYATSSGINPSPAHGDSFGTYTAAGSHTLDLNVPQDGVVIGSFKGYTWGTPANAATWSGLTEDAEVNPFSAHVSSTASALSATAQTPMAVSIAWTAHANYGEHNAIVASFAPASSGVSGTLSSTLDAVTVSSDTDVAIRATETTTLADVTVTASDSTQPIVGALGSLTGATVSRIGAKTTTTDSTTYAFTTAGLGAVSIGSNVSDQTLFFFVNGRSTSTATNISAITVDGVTPSLVALKATTNGSPTNVLGLYAIPRSSLPDPTQTDVDISVTFNAACIRAGIETLAGVGVSTTAYATATDGSTTGGTVNYTAIDVNVLAGGIIIGCAVNGDPSTAYSWTGLTEQDETTYENNVISSALLSNASSTESPRDLAVSATLTAECAVVVASFASTAHAVTLGDVTVSATGTVASSGVSGTLSSTLGTLTVTGTEVTNTNGTLSSTLGALTVSGTSVSRSTVEYVSHSSVLWGNRTDTTITAPSGIQNGDLLLLLFAAGDGGDTTPPSVTPPSGFTEVPNSPLTHSEVGGGGFATSLHIYTKFASSESGDYVVSHSSFAEGLLYCIRGADPTTPLVPNMTTNGVNESSGQGSTLVALGLTTAIDASLVIFAGLNWDALGSVTPPGGFTERHEGTVIYSATELKNSAGATGDINVTTGNAANSPWRTALISIAANGGGITQSTLDAVTVSATGTVASSGVSGTLSSTLGTLTVTGTEVTNDRGALSTTLADVTVSSDTDVAIRGTESTTLADVTVSSDTDVAILATETTTLADVTVTAIEVTNDRGTLSTTLDNVTLSATEVTNDRGTLSTTLADVTLAGTGTALSPGSGSLNVTLADVTVSSDTDVAVRGTDTTTLADVSLTSDTDVAIRATETTTLDNVTLSATEVTNNRGTLSSTLADVTLAATGTVTASGARTATLNVTLDDVTVIASDSTQPIIGTLSTTLDLTLTSDTDVAVRGTLPTQTLGTLTVTGTEVTNTNGVLNSTLGTLTAVGTEVTNNRGIVSTTLADVVISASDSTQPIVGTLSSTLDLTVTSTTQVAVRGSHSSTLGAATLLGTEVTNTNGTLSATLGTATLSGAGLVSTSNHLDVTLADATGSGVGHVVVGGLGNISLGAVVATAALGRVTVVGQANNTISDLTTSAVGRVAVRGIGEATFATLTAQSTTFVLFSTGKFTEAVKVVVNPTHRGPNVRITRMTTG